MELVDLYSGLLASEARHHMLYADLACTVADRDLVKKRLKPYPYVNLRYFLRLLLYPGCTLGIHK